MYCQWTCTRHQEVHKNSKRKIIVTTLPFKRYLSWLIIEMVHNCLFWLNNFPHKGGVYMKTSPRAIMTGQKITYNKHCKVEFGTYLRVHEEHSSMEPRTSGAIALVPSGNEQLGALLYKTTLREKNTEKQLDRIALAKRCGRRHAQTSGSVKTSRK